MASTQIDQTAGSPRLGPGYRRRGQHQGRTAGAQQRGGWASTLSLGDGVPAGQRITDRKGDHEAARRLSISTAEPGRAEPIELPQFSSSPAGLAHAASVSLPGSPYTLSVQRGIAAEDTTAASPPAMAGVTQSAEPRHGICVRLSFCLTPNFHYACESVANSYLFRQIA